MPFFSSKRRIQSCDSNSRSSLPAGFQLAATSRAICDSRNRKRSQALWFSMRHTVTFLNSYETGHLQGTFAGLANTCAPPPYTHPEPAVRAPPRRSHHWQSCSPGTQGLRSCVAADRGRKSTSVASRASSSAAADTYRFAQHAAATAPAPRPRPPRALVAAAIPLGRRPPRPLASATLPARCAKR